MSDLKTGGKRKTVGRRVEDRQIRQQIEQHHRLFRVGQLITSEINLDALFEIVIEQTNEIMKTERSTLFLHDAAEDSLWSLVATGMGKESIRVPADSGIAGRVFRGKTPLIIPDAYQDPVFNPQVDRKTGFRTRNILCIPLINRKDRCIGVLQALNKVTGDFNAEDLQILVSISNYITVALENARLYEDLKVLDKAKERVINHLAHELKTPLSLISSSLGQISKRLVRLNVGGLEKTIRRGQRNLDRLLDLQEKIDDILNERSVEERGQILKLLEDLLSFVEESGEAEFSPKTLFRDVSERIESIYAAGPVQPGRIALDSALHRICDGVVAAMGGREVEIAREIEQGLEIHLDPAVFEKVCTGLLKNAVENTPDEGRIEVRAAREPGRARIDFHDFGVGISAENQKLIFGGFIHTQETDLYSSRHPYDFNAGGAGADLLRIRAFSERFGFSVDFESRRCRFIPGDRDVCPGRISSCLFVRDREACRASGASLFSVRFPLA